MGERLHLESTPIEREYDPLHRATGARPPAERLALGISWNRMAGRLAAALRSLDARVINAGADAVEIDAKMLLRATIWQFTTRDGGVDVMHEVPGGRPFQELRDGALLVRLGEIEVPVVGLDDLIHMKLSRGRPIDLADVAALTDPEAETDR